MFGFQPRDVYATQRTQGMFSFTHARSESINADINFLQLGRKSGGRPQRAVHPMRLPVNTVIHITLVGLEPATFRSLVDCWSDALPVVPPTHQKWRKSTHESDTTQRKSWTRFISRPTPRLLSFALCLEWINRTSNFASDQSHRNVLPRVECLLISSALRSSVCGTRTFCRRF